MAEDQPTMSLHHCRVRTLPVRLIHAAAVVFDCDTGELVPINPQRHVRISRARQAIVALLRRAGLSYPEITRCMGYRDHTSARLAWAAWQQKTKNDAGLDAKLEVAWGMAQPAPAPPASPAPPDNVVPLRRTR